MSDESREILDALEEEAGPWNAWGLALAYGSLGQPEESRRWLEVAYRDRFSSIGWIRVQPEFDALHEDARFQDLLARLNLSD